MSKSNTNGSVNGAIVKSRKGVEPKAVRMSEGELMAAVAQDEQRRRMNAVKALGSDAAKRLNVAATLSFAAWAIGEMGGRAAVYFDAGGDAMLDIHSSPAVDLGGNGLRLMVTDEV
jgi:hypothetical protein